jgi:1-aminocyclopropane-1-carboxylate deaminase/D-cysteine desulfhydrase-like pyridoxal-dependent ACC family enzyme
MQRLLNHPPSPLQALLLPGLTERGIELYIKRDDLLCLSAYPGDCSFSGNKWRKLKYNLFNAQQWQLHTLLTFGGPYSNHLAATASAGALFGFKTIGIVRGERIEPLNPTLSHCLRCGMELQFWERSRYRQKDEAELISELGALYPRAAIIPEGGSNYLGVLGAERISKEIQEQCPEVSIMAAACGTGGTLAGMIRACQAPCEVWGFPVLKGNFIAQEVQKLLNGQSKAPWKIIEGYHFGGYGKTTVGLLDFLQQIKNDHDLPLEPIYTAKLLYGVFDQLSKNRVPEGSKIVVLHSGGLQGWPNEI